MAAARKRSSLIGTSSSSPRMYKRASAAFRDDKRAVTGFFEDLPTLLIAIIALLIFLGQVTAMYDTYEVRWEDIEFKNDAESFARAVRGYEGLAHNNREGVFEATKINSTTTEQVSRDLQPAFKFMIEVQDVGDYPRKYETKLATGELPLDGQSARGEGMLVIRSPIVIWVSEEELHPGALIVSIW